MHRHTHHVMGVVMKKGTESANDYDYDYEQ